MDGRDDRGRRTRNRANAETATGGDGPAETPEEKTLRAIYYDAADPGGYGGVDRLWREGVKRLPGLRRETVEKFLRNEHAYSLHRPARKHFARNPTYVSGIDRQWQADLADMQALARENKGVRYLLTVVDVFSKYAWVVPLKDKSAKVVTAAFRTLFNSTPRKPIRLQTDAGKEFINRELRTLLAEHGIEHFHSYSDQKAACAERFNRTIKQRIWTYFTAHQTKRYLEALPQLVDAYNRSRHRTIGMAPVDVRPEHEARLWVRMFGDGGQGQTPKTPFNQPLNEGDKVRISKLKGDFPKGYTPNWSHEHFVVQPHQPPHKPKRRRVYKLADAEGEEISGSFYREEVQPIDRNKLIVEKVLRRRTIKGKEQEVQVQFKGLPDKFNRWMSASELKQYQR